MRTETRTRFSGLGGLVALGALAIGFGAACAAEPGDVALDETTTATSALTASVFTLHNLQTNYCLGVRAGTPTVGTTLVVWACDGSANQNWAWTSEINGFYTIKNYVATDRCLDATRGQYVTYPEGDSVDINLCDSPTRSTWNVTSVGNDLSGHACYQFSNSYNGTTPQVMGVSAGSTAEGASVILWDNFNDPYGHRDQYWCTY